MKLETFDHGTFLYKVHELFLITLQSLRKATSCEHNNSKYGQGKSGPTSQRTVCRQYVASAPPNIHCPPANTENICTRNLTPRCGPLDRALSSTKLTNQRNMSAHPVVDVADRPKTST